MCHPTEEIFLRYVSGAAMEEEQLEIEKHMARCSQCVELASTLRYIQENFDDLLNSWTASEHGRVYQQWRLVRALHQTAETAPSMAEGIARLYECLRKGMVLCVKVLVDRYQRIACLAQDAIPAGYELRVCPAYSGVGSPEAQSKVEEYLREGSELLSEDKIPEAVNKLLLAGSIDARSSQSVRSEVYRGEQLVAEAIVDSRRGRISVVLWPKPECALRTEAILLPDGATGEVLTATFEHVESQPYIVAEFEDLKHEMYRLWIACETIEGSQEQGGIVR
jgi:hypothetical protein